MAHYLIRASYTPETWAALLKNPSNRREVVRGLVEGMGGKLETLYFSFGDDDIIVIVEAPDNVTIAAAALAVTASGAFRSYSTTPLMTAEEAMDAMRRAAAVGYRPPSA